MLDPTENQLYVKRKINSTQGPVTSNPFGPETDINPPLSGWERNLPQSLTFDDVNIKEHSLNSGKKASKSTTGGRQKTCIRPESKGYLFFTEQYVHDIWACMSKNILFFKAKCFRSQRKDAPPHTLWCGLSERDHTVLKAACSCVAGQSGYCNHILALLYQISHFSKSGATCIPADLSKTSLPQSWHKPRIEGIAADPIMHVGVKHARREKDKQFPSTLYEARVPKAIANDADLLQSVKQQVPPMYGINMVNKETGETKYCRTQLGTHVPLGSPLSYQLALTEGNYQVDFNSISFENFRCTQGCVARGSEAYPSLP